MEGLKPYATPIEARYIDAVIKTGTERRAAEQEGVTHSTIHGAIMRARRRAAAQGYSPEHDMTRPVPDGFHVKGTSTLYDADGQIRQQWVKSNIDRERQEEMLREAVEAMASDLPRVKPTKGPSDTADHLMACYPIGDQHLGMLSWAEEAGEDYDLTIGENVLTGAIDHLVAAAPKCDRAAIVALGDFMHYDSFDAVTPDQQVTNWTRIRGFPRWSALRSGACDTRSKPP
jgi:hypothetical protein